MRPLFGFPAHVVVLNCVRTDFFSGQTSHLFLLLSLSQ
jgi:hypothetical protein